MSILKKVVLAQYKNIIDSTKSQVGNLKVPREGWIRTVRKSIGMSGTQLASRLAITRASVSRVEIEELNGSVTIKTMQKIAQAMECQFVYAIVPNQKIDDVIFKQAKIKAEQLVKKTNVNMALEDQLLSNDKIQFEIERLTQEIAKEIPRDLWDSNEEIKNDNLS